MSTTKDLPFLAQALKAPRISQSWQRLADQARDSGWSHEEYLAAVLKTEVNARNHSGAARRVKAAGFPADKIVVIQHGYGPEPHAKNTTTRVEYLQRFGIPPKIKILGMVARYHLTCPLFSVQSL